MTYILNKSKSSSSVISILDECVFAHFEHLVWILRYIVMLPPLYHLYIEHVRDNIYRGTKGSESNIYSGISSVMYSSVAITTGSFLVGLFCLFVSDPLGAFLFTSSVEVNASMITDLIKALPSDV